MIDDIKRAVEDKLGMATGVLSSPEWRGGGRRETPVYRARWVAIALCREFFPTISTSELGRHFYSEHTAAMHALRTFTARKGTEWPEYRKCKPVVSGLVRRLEALERESGAAEDAAQIVNRLRVENQRLRGNASAEMVREIASLKAEIQRMRSAAIPATMAHELAVLKRENRRLSALIDGRKLR